MANSVSKFIDPADLYTGGYTSNMIEANKVAHRSNATRGVVQVQITSGTVSLEMRLTVDAPWIEVANYAADTIEEVVIAKFMRVIVSADAVVWLGETK